ncbi:ubiquitin-like domain-containing protein [Margalitia sp. FSL K6-0131]|uniref:ubiquitin-like domain-containing protein n=1 Tax=Margalitia sp. FSL K6-0131 TaxID=2954604 RepID=UPI0030F6AB54
MLVNNMKNLLSRTMSKKRWTIFIASFLVFAAAICFITFETTKKTVAMTIDGKRKVIKTHADTVGEILADMNINLHNHDYLSLPVETKVKDQLTVEWMPAKKVTVTVDGKKEEVWTTAGTIQEFVKEGDFGLHQYDQVEPNKDTKIYKDMNIVIKKAFPVTLNNGGKKKKVWSTSTTVGDFLKQQGIVLEELDRTNPEANQKVKPNDVIKVIRVKKVTDVVEEPLEYAVVTQKDSNLSMGEKKVIQHGQNGLVQKLYEVIKENGKEVSRSLVRKNILKDSKSKVVAVGSKSLTNQVSRGNMDTARELYVNSTAYTANCNGCSSRTATGINLNVNPGIKLIAVDPRVIPLGSKVYVEGYGYAIAGDTGGAIRGNMIDVYFSSTSDAYRWGRRYVKIRILK